MLGNNYLKVGNVLLPNPEKFAIKYQNIETIRQAEAGNDVGVVTRLQKRTFSCSFAVSSFWCDKLLNICRQNTVILTYQGAQIEARARISSGNLEKNSEYIQRSDGLWTVGIEFVEV